MTNRVLLNNVEHRDLRVVTRHSVDFGDAINQVLVFPTEFEDLQREYPILFRRDAEGNIQAVALLGLDRDENLFLDGEGWHARYVPAVQRCGPFSIGLHPCSGRRRHRAEDPGRSRPSPHRPRARASGCSCRMAAMRLIWSGSAGCWGGSMRGSK